MASDHTRHAAQLLAITAFNTFMASTAQLEPNVPYYWTYLYTSLSQMAAFMGILKMEYCYTRRRDLIIIFEPISNSISGFSYYHARIIEAAKEVRRANEVAILLDELSEHAWELLQIFRNVLPPKFYLKAWKSAELNKLCNVRCKAAELRDFMETLEDEYLVGLHVKTI